MGRAIAARFPEARAVYDEASEAVGFDVAAALLRGPDRESSQRTDEAAARRSSRPRSRACGPSAPLGIKPDFVVGHSVGEYSALAAAEALAIGTRSRSYASAGRAMAEAAGEHPGAMAAVLGLEDAVVEELCAGIENVWPANYNCPGQIVVSGENAAVDELLDERPPEARARKTVKLRVSGAFHSSARRGRGRRACARRSSR